MNFARHGLKHYVNTIHVYVVFINLRNTLFICFFVEMVLHHNNLLELILIHPSYESQPLLLNFMFCCLRKNGCGMIQLKFTFVLMTIVWEGSTAVMDQWILLSRCTYYISLSMVVLNSRDWHEKNGNWILRASKHTL